LGATKCLRAGRPSNGPWIAVTVPKSTERDPKAACTSRARIRSRADHAYGRLLKLRSCAWHSGELAAAEQGGTSCRRLRMFRSWAMRSAAGTYREGHPAADSLHCEALSLVVIRLAAQGAPRAIIASCRRMNVAHPCQGVWRLLRSKRRRRAELAPHRGRQERRLRFMTSGRCDGQGAPIQPSTRACKDRSNDRHRAAARNRHAWTAAPLCFNRECAGFRSPAGGAVRRNGSRVGARVDERFKRTVADAGEVLACAVQRLAARSEAEAERARWRG